MTATELRLAAHILTLAALLAVIPAILLVGRRGLNMHYRLILALTLGVYAVWFFLLSVSLRDAELLRRGDMVWLLGGIELTGAVLGWTWLVLTVRKSFCLVRDGGKPPKHTGRPLGGSRADDGDIWAQAWAVRRNAIVNNEDTWETHG